MYVVICLTCKNIVIYIIILKVFSFKTIFFPCSEIIEKINLIIRIFDYLNGVRSQLVRYCSSTVRFHLISQNFIFTSSTMLATL